MRALIISDPANLARLDQIRADMAALADPRKTTPARAAEIAAQDPVVALFQYSVHGDEPAGLEAAMQVAYQLLASDEPATTDLLKKVVFVLNPSANPDGHERYATWYNSLAVGADDPSGLEHDEPWGITGRFSHYRFDMNRDLLAQSQLPVQAMMAGLLRWHPQVFVDHHSTTPTFFFPPDAPSVNLNLPAQSARWFEVFGRGNAAAFDRQGWQYFVRDEFDFFYVGYWDEWSSFQGASGMTYETDGGPALNERRDDGTISTFRDGIAHHYVASLATLATAAANRQPRLADYYDFRRSAMDEAKTDRMKQVVIVPGDPGLTAHVVGLLLRDGIDVTRLKQPATSTVAHSYMGGAAGRRTFPAGSYVVDLSQPQRRLAKAILEPQPQLEHDFVAAVLAKYERNRRRSDAADREDYGFYDITAWSLPYTFNLEAYWTEDAVVGSGEAVTDTLLPVPPAPASAASAYVFPDDALAAARLALTLEREGFKLAVALKSFRADGRRWPRGTFVLRTQRNGADLRDRLAVLAPALGVTVTPIQSAFADSGSDGIGSASVMALHAPRILVGAGSGVDETSYGWVWDFFDRSLGTPFTPVALRNIGGMDNLSDYDVLVLPDGGPGRIKRELGDDGVAKLKAWVNSGGVLIAFGGAGDFTALKDVGLSSVSAVGGDSTAKPDSNPPGKTPPLASANAPSRDRPEALPGAIFRATLDLTQWLTVGYEQATLPVFVTGGRFWKASKDGSNAVSFVGDSLTLSGFTFPDNTERLLKGTTWAVVENQGDGHVVLFKTDPLFRAFWRGPARLLTNAILIGPNR